MSDDMYHHLKMYHSYHQLAQHKFTKLKRTINPLLNHQNFETIHSMHLHENEIFFIWFLFAILTDRWIPLDLQNSCNFGCCHPGCNSTWLTAGGTLAISNKSWSFFEEKLLTPIALALPESYNASIALHVLGMLGIVRFSSLNSDPLFMLTGQWIYKMNQFN